MRALWNVLCGKSANSLTELLLAMPKDRSNHLRTLKAARRMPGNKANYPPGVIQMQVLGTGGRGAPPALYLFTDQTRYLFNCGEGTQRLSHEHKTKLSKLEHIFVTSNKWERIGGLPGLTLTVQDIGIDDIHVHAPQGLEHLFSATKRFVVLKDLEVKVINAECDEREKFFEDHILRVDYIPLKVKKSGEDQLVVAEEDPTTDYYSHAKKGRPPTPPQASAPVVHVATETSMCYIVQTKKKEGSLLIDRCIQRGVPPGPLLGKLKSGMDITLPNGTVVKANEVRSPDCPGPVFIVIECPTLAHMDELLANTKVKELLETRVAVVVHFTPAEVLLNKRYKDFMEAFHTTTNHLIMNELCDFPSGSEAVHKLQTKLCLVDPHVFPRLIHDLEQGDSRRPKQLDDYKVPIVLAESGLKVTLRPDVFVDATSVLKIKEEIYLEGIDEELKKELEETRGSLQPITTFPRLVFLGTGSSIPNKTRNVSAFLLQVDQNSSMLLDCGEGTLLQLNRFFGPNLREANLKGVYISHLHADHHLGLISLLKQYPGLTVFAPRQIRYWLDLYSTCFETISYTLIPLDTLSSSGDNSASSFPEVGLKSMRTTLVRHCPNAFGVCVETNEGLKVTYSGDTMPCDDLVRLGEGSDILVHEATMEDELKGEALMKMHSTVSQAIEIGRKMKARFTILTHFSQRYAKVPLVDESLEDVGIAFDNMTVGLDDPRRISLCRLGGTFQSLFSDDVDEMNERAKKRRLKKEILQQQDIDKEHVVIA